MKMLKSFKAPLVLIIFFALANVTFANFFSYEYPAFKDVTASDEFYYVVDDLKERNLITGYEDGTFKPDNKINRAEFLKIVLETAKYKELLNGEISGSNCFKDVKEEWFAPYICKAKELGIISGYPDNTFKPEQNISLAEASKILAQALQLDIDLENNNENWYGPFVFTLAKRGVIPNTVLGFGHEMTRGEMACMIGGFTFAASCENLNYDEIVSISSLEDATLLSAVDEVRKFYQFKNKVYFIDEIGAVHNIVGSDPQKFRQIVGDLYTDEEKLIFIEDHYNFPIEVNYISKSDFDLSTLKLIEEDTDTHKFLQDKNNIYFSCDSDPASFSKLLGATPENFRIISHFIQEEYSDYLTYVTNGDTLYVTQEDIDSEYSCEMDVFNEIDIDSFEMVFDAPKDWREIEHGILMFVKDKKHVYDLYDLKVFQDADPSTFKVWSILYEDIFLENPGEEDFFYFAEDKNSVWIRNMTTEKFELNKEIKPGTFKYIGTFEHSYEYEAPYPGYYPFYYNYPDAEVCDSLAEDFGYGEDLEKVEEDGEISRLILTENGTCTILSLSPDEDQYGLQEGYAHGFLMKDDKNIWITDDRDFKLKKIELEVDLPTFEGLRYRYDDFVFKDQYHAYTFDGKSVSIIEGMDASTLQSQQFDESQWLLSDKNGLWYYDYENGGLTFINNADYADLY